MKEDEYKVAGFSFSNVNDYKEAKHDEETIELIRSRTDLNDLNKTIKLYQKLVERRTLKSVVGCVFLKELQDRIIKSGIVTKDNLLNIPIENNESELIKFSNATRQERDQKHQEALTNLKIKIKNARIIISFLVVIILSMILISVFSDRNVFVNYENKVLDQYASWEEELNTREAELDKREEALEAAE